MKNEMKLNNKGFSLVELIVVIAIMAILVGVLAPSVLGQIDKAKVSKDKQAIDTVASAVSIAWADQDVKNDTKQSAFDFPVVHANPTSFNTFTDSTSFMEQIYNTVGFTEIELTSNAYNSVTKLEVKINTSTGKVTVTTVGATGDEYSITK